VTAENGRSVTAFSREPSTGRLTQLAEPSGCYSPNLYPSCSPVPGLDAAYDVAISGDDRFLYVATDKGVIPFRRDDSTGALAPLPGGCITQTGADGCRRGRSLDGVQSVAISPDGQNLYAAATYSSGIALFSRDRETGQLTQAHGRGACVSEDGSEGCRRGRGLLGAQDVTDSRDGRRVYLAARRSHAVVVFNRDSEGSLRPLAGRAGCVSYRGRDRCQAGRALRGARSVVVSPDGRRVYIAARTSSAITIFRRTRLRVP
jgi:DNA-binding beta-propeller fold protein YncE